MTSNQINYAKLLEEKRANLAREAENARADTLNYNASVYSTQGHMWAADRSALATENAAALNYNARMQELSETAKHNRAQEAENLRHNAATEVVSSRESDTHRAQQQEANRHNVVSEKIDTYRTVGQIVGTVVNAVTGMARMLPLPIR